MKKIFYTLLATSLFLSCQKDQEASLIPTEQKTILINRTDIDNHIKDIIKRDGIYDWQYASDDILYSAAMQSDSIFSLGYQVNPNDDMEHNIHHIDIRSDEWIKKQEELLNFILEGEQVYHPDFSIKDLLPFGEPELLPSMEVRITNPNTIADLRKRSDIRYLEAMGYSLDAQIATERSSSGCGSSPNYGINPADYTTISPNVKRPWNHDHSNIASAWNTSKGSGVTITVIDTGVSDDQNNLGSYFSSGYSYGRFVQKYSTKYSGYWWWRSLDAPHDQCGHGTEMSGLATAPRGYDGNAVGVAYKANLIGIRAVEDVIISSSNEKAGVRNALVLAGNRSDVRVISMSLGSPFSSGTVRDGIYYAYNKGKMIVSAAGTSLTWTNDLVDVIFPANMSQTVAVTGVNDGYNNGMTKCNTCHSGAEVDFVMVMQRQNDASRNTLTLSLYGDQPTYISGSSAATASVAGIAALVFAEHPNATASQVFNAMKQSASFYPYRNNEFGWGIIDAAQAVNMNL